MKKILTFIIIILSLFTFGQTPKDTIKNQTIFSKKHEIKVGGINLIAGPILEITYEHVYSKDFSFGSSILVNLNKKDIYREEFSITPFARIYFQETKEYGANGFFVEGFGKYFGGRFIDYNIDYNTNYNINNNTYLKKYSSVAVGISLGKKWINKSGFVIEILGGLGRVLGASGYQPSILFRGDLNIGYRF
jgi:hypothetical protein